MNKHDIIQLIESDAWMMKILKTVDGLNLPDWWIGAGFVRGKVWDTLHRHKKRTPLPDIDVIYFDKKEFDKGIKETKKQEKYWEGILKNQMPTIKWSVINQARMHLFHNQKPYKNSEQALAQWVETATCIGVRLDRKNHIELCAPHGIKDLIRLVVRQTPGTTNSSKTFRSRIEKKHWLKKWPKLKLSL